MTLLLAIIYNLRRIGGNHVIKVSDFGLTQDIYSKNYFRLSKEGNDGDLFCEKLPIRWMAIESLNDGLFSQKTDVVSHVWSIDY